MYVGCRHDEIASLSRGCLPEPQRQSPRLSLDGSPNGRGSANLGGSSPSRRPVMSPEQRLPEPRPTVSSGVFVGLAWALGPALAMWGALAWWLA
jgi:hypothetical protein